MVVVEKGNLLRPSCGARLEQGSRRLAVLGERVPRLATVCLERAPRHKHQPAAARRFRIAFLYRYRSPVAASMRWRLLSFAHAPPSLLVASIQFQ